MANNSKDNLVSVDRREMRLMENEKSQPLYTSRKYDYLTWLKTKDRKDIILGFKCISKH